MTSTDTRQPKATLGFSLIEVLVAMVVLAVGILGVMGAFSFSMQALSVGTRQSEAVTIAERELQRAILVAPQSTASVDGRGGQYRWRVDFAERPEGLVLATVVVSWSVRGEPQEYRLSRLFLPPQQGT